MKMKKILSLGIALSLILGSTGAFAEATNANSQGTDPNLMSEETFLEQYILENYKDKVTQEQLDLAKYRGLFESLDPYSRFYTKEEFTDLNESLSGSFVGIGVHISETGKYIHVDAPIKGSPAEQAGMQAGDIIFKVDGKNIGGMTMENVIKLIRGDEGTYVKITVWKAKTGKEMTYNVRRSVIENEIVTSKTLESGYGYVSLSEFDRGASEKVIAAIKGFKNPKGIVLDLRDNPGGYLSEAVALADFFLPKGSEIVSIDYRSEEDQVIRDDNDGYTLPVVVLVNKNSASASEIVSSALQKNNRAKIVGENSFGKGTVQDVIPLNTGEGFKLTVAEYKGPNNTKINGVGVKPDYGVNNHEKSEADVFKTLSPMTETKVYKAGETGLNVFGAQQRLNLLGSKLSLTAKMDTATVNALKSYQKTNKLKVTGLIDASTKKSLEEKTKQLYNQITSDVQLAKALEVLKAQ